MKTIFIQAFMALLLAFTSADNLTGRWETQPSEKGNITGVVFKDDGSFEGYVNKKPFVTGNYVFEDSTLSFTDNGCNGAKGTYVIHFFSGADSLRFEAIDDSCTERKEGMERLVMGRIK